MPLYDYQCQKCDVVVEVTRRINDEHAELCEECGTEMRRVFSAPKVVYKGSGWAWQEKIPQRTDIVIGADPTKKDS